MATSSYTQGPPRHRGSSRDRHHKAHVGGYTTGKQSEEEEKEAGAWQGARGGYTTGKQSEEEDKEEVGAHNHIEIADTARPSNTAA